MSGAITTHGLCSDLRFIDPLVRKVKLLGSKDVWDYYWDASICSSADGKIMPVYSDEESRLITAIATCLQIYRFPACKSHLRDLRFLWEWKEK